jgi:O-methyltransferase
MSLRLGAGYDHEVTVKQALRSGLRRVLARPGLRRVPTRRYLHPFSGGLLASERRRYRQAIEAAAGAMSASSLSGFAVTEERVDRLVELIGTEPGEGLFVVDRLLDALRAEGDVCEFGVAQGATSSMLAGELLNTDRRLWLYDSFEGLPAPTPEDVLIDDVLSLGSMAAYEGWMAYGEEHVRERLAQLGFPDEQVVIRKGFVTADMSERHLPDCVCFAYVDFDLYAPIRDALTLLHPRVSVGGWIIVDDYGHLSAGAKQAADEFVAAHADEYEVELGPSWAGHFLMLCRAITG